jgi:DNA-binding GntR family transcriptional regulator
MQPAAALMDNPRMIRTISSSAAPGATASADMQSASDLVFFGIVNGLEMQSFVPAQRLAEVDLAARFGVGRNSVREALQRLSAEGIVELLRHRGAAIRSLSLQDTMDVLDVAERMTGLLARCAADSAAQAGSVKAMQLALREAAAADAAPDAAAFSLARRRFYRALLEMSGNRELKRLFPSIQMPIVYAQHRLPALQKLRLHDYRKIAGAVEAGNASMADAAGSAHVRNVRKEILKHAQ